MKELIVDNFAGGGGASIGIFWATGRHPDIAVNHDAIAIECHSLNHPETKHYVEDVWKVDPVDACEGRPVGLAWFSPDCTHFSKAKGGQPRSNKIRGLAWVVIRWAEAVAPRVIVIENVEEFRTWGPLNDDGVPCKQREGQTFGEWHQRLEGLGYRVEYRTLHAHHYGAPTIRKRLFIIARRDGEPIVWPDATHSDLPLDGLPAFRTAAECIDWSIPAPSIFDRKRPLAESTLRRISAGVKRFILNEPEPFIAPLRGTSASHISTHSIGDPLSTVSVQGTHHALVSPTLIQTGYGEREGQAPRALVSSTLLAIDHQSSGAGATWSPDQPLTTITTKARHCVATAFMAKHYTGVTGHGLEQPIGTVTTVDHHSLVVGKLSQDEEAGAERVRAFLVAYYGNESNGQALDDPLRTITTHDRFGLEIVQGEPYRIVDIGMRMLQPHELAGAQGFPADYQFGNLTKRDTVRLIGNSVCPHVAEAIVRANYVEGE